MAANWAARLGLAGVLLGAALAAGCGSNTPQEETGKNAKEPETSSSPSAEKAEVPAGVQAAAPGHVDPALSQPFAEATLADPPDGQELPDRTLTGKSVGKLYSQVVALWDKIPFVSPAGKKLNYRAVLDTELGTVEIALRPDLAPNHVRSFVALARAGYYDGLVFERTVHEESDAGDGQTLDYVEGGCPLGTGEPSYGSIGYWLHPEISDRVKHEPGTVGAWYVEEPDTAACKFYITLTAAPIMDGNWTIFGKVVKGLDVVRAISKQPVRMDEYRDRPERPVVIRKVTILTQEDK